MDEGFRMSGAVMPASPCSRCGTPHTTAGGLCPDCRAAKNAKRAGERERYGKASRGWSHQKRAADLRREGQAYGLGCHICGKPIDYTLKPPSPWTFNADHLTADPDGPLAPSHAACNNRRGVPKT